MTNPIASLPNLPGELQELIVSHISNSKALASLSQTCKTFHHLTKDYLYGSVLIRDGKMNAFAAAVNKEPRRKELVRILDVDYIGPEDKVPGHTYSDYSACTFAPLFMEFPNLQSLKLASAYWHFDNDGDPETDIERDPDEVLDRLPVNWPRDQERLDEAFKKAGLLTPPNQRIWKQLTSVTLDFWEENNQGAFLTWDPSIFLIEQLQELTIRGMHFHEGDAEDLVDSPHRGTTGLKKLNLERSAIHDIALQRFLLMPKALTHLKLQHHEGFEGHEIGNYQHYSSEIDDWNRALESQKDNLQFLHFDSGPWDKEELLANVWRYPSLKVFETYLTEHEITTGRVVDNVEAAREHCEVTLFQRPKYDWDWW